MEPDDRTASQSPPVSQGMQSITNHYLTEARVIQCSDEVVWLFVWVAEPRLKGAKVMGSIHSFIVFLFPTP